MLPLDLPGRKALFVVAFVILCVVLTAGSEQRRVGDAGEYTAMAWQFAHLRPPALTAADASELDSHYRSLDDRMPLYVGSTPLLPSMEKNGRYDQLHFWIYPLAVSPLTMIVGLFGQPDTYAFAIFNITLATFALVLVLERLGFGPALLLFASPILWWIDKPHGEILIFCLLTVSLLWRHDRPLLGLLCMAFLAAHNLGFALAFIVYGAGLVVEHGRSLFDKPRKRLILILVTVLAVIHPLYYLLRIRAVDPQTVLGAASVRIPTVTRLLTPVLDPYVGIIVWWPLLVLVAFVGGLNRIRKRPREPRTVREWTIVCMPAAVAAAVLFAGSQNVQPDSGGTFSMSRFAVWIAPFAIYGLGDRLLTHRVTRLAVVGVALSSMVLSLGVAHPAVSDNYWTLESNFVADLVFDQAPWAWNPVPQIFLARQLKSFNIDAPVANQACTKVLTVVGQWPNSCPAPIALPEECAASPYCYANWTNDRYMFVPVQEKG